MSENNGVLARIKDKYAELSPSARTIANYLQQFPLTIISDSTSEIAAKTNTSKATVSRLFRQLGYASHQDAKQDVVLQRDAGIPVKQILDQHDYVAAELGNLQRTLEAIPAEQINQVAELLANAPRITLIGYRNSYPVALHCRQQLKQIRPNVRLLPQPGQSLSEDIMDLSADEIILVFGFRRRPRIFARMMEALPPDRTLLFTDPTGQVYQDRVKHLLLCQLGNQFAFDSYAAPMSLVSVICNQAYTLLGDEGDRRVSTITSLYAQMGELDPE
ncbi:MULTISPECIES: MurR/RpiR family transcriptional regulator [Marisediminitalea]|uniref:MurR/RpiR family transcriptional regulator n=1 Tax=Marisediminitalea TaxID=2662254 RepID=UPI0020CD8606|nr:MurR/RpiR family transcriptional regulator [Marisediminitalea aggregata]MCP3865587.1 MurR/RpiR family transcriptional regulator [Aestuariibacter sp.]MCP4235309.1 MurR/RpiR family transcriptional regulator [Aestuariibacter sp.]MCP4529183.1 MurR/RpiR family transcriptional regulator [Aestuariibacter sp.]MCP4948324.1 MurR/RpiR family transcriptional regulator [Aestuariibacter sp.]MCP5011628.1 MurR/RpiR family transcriptional regulator [Aestuariibacter sp.]